MAVATAEMHHHGNAPTAESSSSTAPPASFAPVSSGASLMLSFRPIGRRIIVVGAQKLAVSRIKSVLEADAVPVVVCSQQELDANDEIRWRVSQQQCLFRAAPRTDTREAWSGLLDEVDGGEERKLFAVCITDTLHAGDEDDEDDDREEQGAATRSPLGRAKMIARLAKAKRVPVNVADRPALCDFSLPATHRFASTAADGPASALQIAVTTNGKGCRLAGRIRREIVASLPRNVGDAVERVGTMREMARRQTGQRQPNGKAGVRDPSLRRRAFTAAAGSTNGTATISHVVEDAEEEDLTFDDTPINSPVPQLHSPGGQHESPDGFFDAPAAAARQLQERQDAMTEERKRRMRWVAQMSEYWPIDFLGSLSHDDMTRALNTYKEQEATAPNDDRRGREKVQTNEAATKRTPSQHNLSIDHPRRSTATKGHIFLVGSGPGHPGLLTAMAYRLLTSTETDVVLSDKLVPASILALIPKQTTLHIARKFPGNAEGAQSELIDLALEAAHAGKCVVRLKQGDPFVYGRGGEEVLAFTKAGVESTLVPGISSALAAPLLLGIPVTQRGAADSMILCTGVGRGGKSVSLPGYERSRSLVILMGVARLHDVVETLTYGWSSSGIDGNKNPAPAGTRTGAPFPPYTPIAIIERASSTDQRLIASTLENIERSLQRSGEQRPPGMMLIGWAALSLDNAKEGGNVDVLDEEKACQGDADELERRDRRRVARWLGPQEYIVRQGLDDAYKRELGLSNVAGKEASAAAATVTAEANGAAPTDAVQSDEASAAACAVRGPSGWAPPRYGPNGVARGGWGHGEEAVGGTAVLPSVEEK